MTASSSKTRWSASSLRSMRSSQRARSSRSSFAKTCGGLVMGGESPIKPIANWPVSSLSDVTLKIGSGATPRGGGEVYLRERERFALIRSQNVFDRHFDVAGLAFISE